MIQQVKRIGCRTRIRMDVEGRFYFWTRVGIIKDSEGALLVHVFIMMRIDSCTRVQLYDKIGI